MITVTVKTLDAENHTFEVEDDITVSQFKTRIADSVNIPAETQRMIYCGRVLQDTSKLNDYDVNGKVVHLVQRAPPRANQTPRSPSPPQQARRLLLEPANTMYLGSMTLPPSLVDIPPPPTATLAGSRLNVARRMLRRAEAAIRALENPTARASEQAAQEDTQEDVTPVIEARVIVPNTDNGAIDEAMVISAVHDSLLNASATQRTPREAISTTSDNNAVEDAQASQSSRPQSGSSTPGTATPTRSSTENLAGDEQRAEGGDSTNSNSTQNTFPENGTHTSEMAELLTQLSNLQLRFAPFLERYHNFMRDDPAVPREEVRQTQSMLTRVSSVLHLLGHAYHSLSDVIIRVRTPPPRPLLCRPILIQQSAVVQAGIPIQVEAQINLSTDHRPPTEQTTTSTTATTTSTPTPTEATQPSNSGGATATMNFPFFPTASMRVQSFPIEIRGMSQLFSTLASASNLPAASASNPPAASTSNPPAASAPNPPAASAPNPPAASTSNPPAASTSAATPASNSAQNSAAPPETPVASGEGAASAPTQSNIVTTSSEGTTQPPATTASGSGASSSSNNPNVEILMEVTPEGITIDSLEATLLGSNQPHDLLRGGPSPELLQSIVRMAGQIINSSAINVAASRSIPPSMSQQPAEMVQSMFRMVSQAISQRPSNGQQSTPAAPGTSSAEAPTSAAAATSETNQSSQSSVPLQTGSGQTSQARSNVQTNPTTATHTRSTPRPHVHLAHQAIQGGFDPYLPCSSHHLPPRRRHHNQTLHHTLSTASRINFIGTVINRPESAQGQANSAAERSAAAASSNAPSAAPANASSSSSVNDASSDEEISFPFPNFLQFMQHTLGPESAAGFRQSLLSHMSNTPQGQNVIADFLMMLVEHLNLGDFLVIRNGGLGPLDRIRGRISAFIRTNIFTDRRAPRVLERGGAKVMDALGPFFECLNDMPTRDNIDAARTADAFLRPRIIDIMVAASALDQNDVRHSVAPIVEEMNIVITQFVALCKHISANGQRGVEETFDRMLSRLMQGIVPRNLQQWVVASSRIKLREYLAANVNVTPLESFIAYKPASTPAAPASEAAAVTPAPAVQANRNAVSQSQRPTSQQEFEPMDIDDQEAGGSGSEARAPVLPPINVEQASEGLPNVVIGSEPWHGQVPADWVPIITRDAQKQRRQGPQRPFSDGYLSGMPSKRRKLINNSKPLITLPQVISESVRRAVVNTGLTHVAPVDSVAQAASECPEVLTAYRSLLRSSVQATLRDNQDFTPERFPNASQYFKKSQ